MNKAPLAALFELAADLTLNLSSETRYQRLTAAVKDVFPCDAATLLGYVDGTLVPLAVEGLSDETLGQHFHPKEHPRLAAIIEAGSPVVFADDDPRPDPFDGLLTAEGFEQEPDVHSCMGCALRVEEDLVGALTLDALEPGRFNDVDLRLVEAFATLAAATMRTAGLIEALEKTAERRGQVARDLVLEALQREGGEILGQSKAIQQVHQEIDLVAPSMLTVLVMGETGTGKELVARTIHARSNRADQPLVHVNCAALPESIAESELFGHVKGAFTGAVATRMGKFELADGATLFLDEIGELPLSIQAKLLRALQFGEVQRVGSDTTGRVDVRIIAATNRDLATEVEEGRFRPDLYHRLSVYPLTVPPLRKRLDDILLLAGHFLGKVRVQLGLGRVRLTPGARRSLLQYDWPGNVRELDHVITRAALRASRGTSRDNVVNIDADVLGLSSSLLPPSAPDKRPAPEIATPAALLDEFLPEDKSLQDAVDEFQRRVVERAVEDSGGNWSAAARRLNMDRSNLHRLGKRLGLN